MFAVGRVMASFADMNAEMSATIDSGGDAQAQTPAPSTFRGIECSVLAERYSMYRRFEEMTSAAAGVVPQQARDFVSERAPDRERVAWARRFIGKFFSSDAENG